MVAITGTEPTRSASDAVTLQLTFGALAGTLPSTSRSKSSRISGRRDLDHICAEATGRPSFITSGSGQSGNGLALASS